MTMLETMNGPINAVLKDSFGRVINNLRISVTDRCNFRCSYCMPEKGMEWINKKELLTFNEIKRLTKLFAKIGIKKIRLTGGEPLVRKDLGKLVSMISEIPGIEDLALTTNGYLLAEQVETLYKAGLNRINVSLDSLDPEKFSYITRRKLYHKVREGIRAAEKSGIKPIKINVVMIRGVNDDEILNFANLALKSSYIIRFIEFMPIGADDGWNIKKIVPTQEIINVIEKGSGKKLIPVERRGKQPADRYKFDGGNGEIGFISSVSNPFCNYCNRVRITPDGKLRTCLFSLKETDLKELIHLNATDQEITKKIIDAVWVKEAGHLINRPGFVRPKRTMSQIGG